MKREISILILAFAVTALAIRTVAADPIADGAAANNRGDYATAWKLWRPLAERGNASAQVFLGGLFESGHGVEMNPSEAARWYGLAALQGDANGQFFLGRMYDEGKGLPQDSVLAYKWFDLACAHYSVEPERTIACSYRARLASTMTPEQIAEGQQLAREWKPK